MIKCPNPDCGLDNVDGTQFCEGCGEELTAAPAAASASAPVAGGEIQCPACDNMNPADNLVCEVCGTELQDSAAPVVAPPVAAAPPAVDPANAATSGPIAAPDADTPAGIPVATPDPAVAPAITPFDSPAFQAPAADDTAPIAVADTSDDQAAAPPSIVTPTALPTTPPNLLTGDVLQVGRVKMTVEQGMSVGAQFVLGDTELLVGREDEEEDIYPDIDLSDQDAGFVHRRHATLRFEETGLMLTHLGGANKTRINNRPIPDNVPQPVSLGDKIAFGKVVVRVQANP